MKLFFTFTIFMSLFINATAQQVSKLKLSGFNVTFVHSTEFSHSYETDRNITEELKGDRLTIKAIGVNSSEERANITINYVDLESIELENCKLDYTSILSTDKLTLNLDKNSEVNLKLNVQSFKANLKNGSKLSMKGSIRKKAEVKLSKESSLNSYSLSSNSFSLHASEKSISNMHINTENINLNLSSLSLLTLAGQSKTLKAKASNESIIDASGVLNLEKAQIETKAKSSIKVKAKHLKSNTKI